MIDRAGQGNLGKVVGAQRAKTWSEWWALMIDRTQWAALGATGRAVLGPKVMYLATALMARDGAVKMDDSFRWLTIGSGNLGVLYSPDREKGVNSLYLQAQERARLRQQGVPTYGRGVPYGGGGALFDDLRRKRGTLPPSYPTQPRQ